MKKVIKALSVFLFLLSLLMLLVACNKCSHVWKHTKAENIVEATETSEGSYDEVVYCMNCNKKLSTTQNVIAKLPCLHSDANEDFACDKCAEFFVELSHTLHTYDREVAEERFQKTAATCTEAAVYYKSCGCRKTCEETFTYGWPKHTFEDKVDEALLVSAADCHSASVYYKSCACGEISEETFLAGDRIPHEFSDGYCMLCSEPFVYVREGEYIYFGMFPQTIKSSNVEITNAPLLGGAYLGSDGERYVKVVAEPFADTGYTFSNGAVIENDEVYYFKLEPIKWRVIEEADGEATLLCENIIANMAFCPESVGDPYYLYNSIIRGWLLGEFCDTAFNDEQLKALIPAEKGLVNCAAGDTVYILHVNDATNSEYGFPGEDDWDVKRQKKVTDYARATGAQFRNSNDDPYYGCGYWWLGSTRFLDSNNTSDTASVDYVTYVGSIRYSDEFSLPHEMTGWGVVPAVRIRLVDG